jgi:hypothetical protein
MISCSRAFASGVSPRRSMRSANNSRSPRPTGFRSFKSLGKKRLHPPGRQAGHRSPQYSGQVGSHRHSRNGGFGPGARRQTLSERRNVEGVLIIPADMSGGKTFALRVKGDSMIGAGIMDGDRVIVKQQSTAENGEIVCALIDGEATLKRFFKKDGVVTLKAENEKYAPITLSGSFA